MSGLRRTKGQLAERLATAYLRGLGREIIQANYRTPYGEIDIIVRDGQTVCFVEVRSRSTSPMVTPAESVNQRKQQKLLKAAAQWLQENQEDCPSRFDVLEVEFPVAGPPRVVSLIEDAFGQG